MKGSTIRCVRCKGRKKLYKINNCYTYTNTGGVETNCPLCLGEGKMSSLSDALEEAKKVNSKHKKEKDIKDESKPTQKPEQD